MVLNSVATQIKLDNLRVVKPRLAFGRLACAVIVLLSFSCSLKSASISDDYENYTFDNFVYSDDIKTIEIRKQEEYPSYPTLLLNSEDVLSISFDDLSDFDDDYYYKIIHCSHEWTPSDLESNEYLSGFPELAITDLETSFNTAIDYTHYEFDFPTDMMSPRLSGNYLLVVYPENEEDKPIFTTRIIVYEQIVRYRYNLKESSVIKDRNTHHEIDFDIAYNGYQVDRPYEDIHNTLLQNFNWHTAITDLKPVFVKNTEISYDYGEENTFPGNNEFRFVSFAGLRSINAQIDSLGINPVDLVPEITLEKDVYRTYRLYTTMPDINGEFKINSLLGFDDTIESEYCRVTFKLERDTPLLKGQSLYVFTEAGLNPISDAFKMTYDYKAKLYKATILLKQGYYNYSYAITENNTVDFTSVEGSHFQTENDYHVITYDSNSNLGYDRVIGLLKTNTFNE